MIAPPTTTIKNLKKPALFLNSFTIISEQATYRKVPPEKPKNITSSNLELSAIYIPIIMPTGAVKENKVRNKVI